MKIKTIFLVALLTSVWMSLSSQYSTDDMNALLAIDDICDVNDQLNWNTTPNPANWSGITWNLNTPKRVTEINVDLKNLTGILDVTPLDSITRLFCNVNQLTELKIANLQKLSLIDCNANLFTGMDLSNLPKLDWLNCMSNQITDLDLSGCPNLTSLQTQHNPIGNLDLTAVPRLKSLGCYSNQLDSLDVSHLTDLNSLFCYSNNLKKLDVSNLTNLTLLQCLNNPLDSLDIRNLTNLKDLNCRDNNLSRLDLSNQINLERLCCSNNQIDSLDVSNLTKLKEFNCSENLLTRIDVSNLTQLTALICDGNLLTYLDITGLTNLDQISCIQNKIPFSRLPLNSGYAIYNYSPMNKLYDTLTVYNNIELDYSSEALINTAITNFIFYKYGFPVDTNSTGLYTTTSPGEYNCEMTNANFPGLTQVTSTIKVAGFMEMSVSENELEVDYKAGSHASFEIVSNTLWSVSSSLSWLAPDPVVGIDKGTITITAAANPDTLPREASLTVSGAGVDSFTISVVQAARPNFSVSNTTVEISYQENSTSAFDIISSYAWTISNIPAWLTLSSVSGSGNETITPTAQTNTSNLSRIATINISSPGLDTIRVKITQSGVPVSGVDELFNENELVYPNPVNEKLNIKLTSNDLPAIIQVYSFDGKQVLSKETNSSLTEVEMETLHSGIYILKIVTPIQTIEKKIIKQQ